MFIFITTFLLVTLILVIFLIPTKATLNYGTYITLTRLIINRDTSHIDTRWAEQNMQAPGPRVQCFLRESQVTK